MVFIRVAAFAASEFADVIAVVGVVRRAGPTFAILRISCPQMVQIGSKHEIELGIAAWHGKLYSKVPEIVGDDFDARTTTVSKHVGICGKTAEAHRQIDVVVPRASVPRHDCIDTSARVARCHVSTIASCALRTTPALPCSVSVLSRAACNCPAANKAGRTTRAFALGIAVSGFSRGHKGAFTFHGKIGNRSGVTEAESEVLGVLGETDRLVPSMVRRRSSPFAASESTLVVAGITEV
jgi:hypothetical protein